MLPLKITNVLSKHFFEDKVFVVICKFQQLKNVQKELTYRKTLFVKLCFQIYITYKPRFKKITKYLL